MKGREVGMQNAIMEEEDERQVYTGNSWWKTWKHPINKLREREQATNQDKKAQKLMTHGSEKQVNFLVWVSFKLNLLLLKLKIKN